MSISSYIRVAVGIVFNTSGQVLVALRPEEKRQGGLWEFPGGKIEQGETVFQALQRELWEEVGIDVVKAIPLTQCHYEYNEHAVVLEVWRVESFTGEASGREGQKIAWVTREELSQLPVLSANHPIVALILNLKMV